MIDLGDLDLSGTPDEVQERIGQRRAARDAWSQAQYAADQAAVSVAGAERDAAALATAAPAQGANDVPTALPAQPDAATEAADGTVDGTTTEAPAPDAPTA